MNSRNHQENTLKRKKIVSVIGTSTATPELYELARETGRLLAERGCVVVCGEHGGDPASIDFFHATGLNYVSCSPFRVPIARFAAAKAALVHRVNDK